MRVVLDNLRDHHGTRYLHKGMLRKRIPSFGVTTKKATKSWLDERLEERGEHLEETVLGFYRKAFNHLRHFGNVGCFLLGLGKIGYYESSVTDYDILWNIQI